MEYNLSVQNKILDPFIQVNERTSIAETPLDHENMFETVVRAN